ncbi:MAG: dephospho-CoA kinase [candidate division Zixibacteria bacterium]|nr:dephospho-CoA kinase [candidate division Zixibacteria bacterium]
MIIGITGLIGSGKSTAARILAEHGAALIDADKIAREVIELYPALLKKLVRQFGGSILMPSGRLRRKKLAALAFAGEQATRQLNRLTHPYIVREIRKQTKRALRQSSFVVIDAPLLLGSAIEKDMDLILVIHAGEEIRLKRLLKRGMTATDAHRRMRTQLPFTEFRRRADRLILNNGSLISLEKKLLAYLEKIAADRLGIG